MSRILLYGMCGMDNLGDDLMYSAISRYLNQNNIKIDFIERVKWKNYFFNEKKPTCVKFIIYNAFFTRVGFAIRKYINVLYSKFRDIEFACVMKKMQEGYSALVFLGGGYLTSDYSVMSEDELDNILLLINTAKKAGIKVIFSGLTVGPFEEKKYLSKKVADILKFGDWLSVRDKFSLNEIEKLGLKAELIGDNIFLFGSENKCRECDFSGKYIIVNLKSHMDQSQNLVERKKIIAQLCVKYNGIVKVVPFRSDVDGEEYKINQLLADQLVNLGIECELIIPNSVDELINLYSNAHIVIGSAYHCVALALLFKRKLYTWYDGLYYQYKIDGIIELCGAKSKELIGTRIFEILDGSAISTDYRVELVKREWNNIVQLIK
ncbi:polysaccharide pyruvyl transferase family protein [Youngiibacter multivorans]|uniref:Polysaccharide pyruvyl transferase WcaK-like protein n=1 Tax=Youngiibacter multivorans TaxID=937251 RepID=A0ABS4G6M4_9CLOT|nr:polysaccharide pyruvyl transferase family protein [Youngiibacter multivorans]MBP1920102.1 polysaccharide pyruvyl transferase WcaK-like protein [Youngiibacter multivorans]